VRTARQIGQHRMVFQKMPYIRRESLYDSVVITAAPSNHIGPTKGGGVMVLPSDLVNTVFDGKAGFGDVTWISPNPHEREACSACANRQGRTGSKTRPKWNVTAGRNQQPGSSAATVLKGRFILDAEGVQDGKSDRIPNGVPKTEIPLGAYVVGVVFDTWGVKEC